MSAAPDSLVGTRLPESVCARCAHAGGLLGWLEAALPPLPFAMCFSAAEERPGGILALPNGFLKTLVAKRYGDELVRHAESVGLEQIEIVVDPTVTIVIVCQLHDEDGHSAEPEVITRGIAFEGVERAETLLDEVYECAADTIDAMPEREIKLLQTHIHDAVAELIYTRSRKRPLVITVIIDV